MTKELISEIDKLKRDLAFKREELQAMYMEHKQLSKKVNALEKENHSYKQQIKQLEEEAQELLLYP
jgi:predicted  nucleic acid-binding Zn-ribbon protein